MEVMKSCQMQDTFQSRAAEFDGGMEKENTRMTSSYLFFFLFLKLIDELLFVIELLNPVWVFCNPWTVALQAPRQENEWDYSLLQRIFPTRGSNPYLLHCRQILYHWAIWEASGWTLMPFTETENPEERTVWRKKPRFLFLSCYVFLLDIQVNMPNTKLDQQVWISEETWKLEI